MISAQRLRTAFACCLLVAASARADLFSPGELAKPHHSLEGMQNCTQCHPAGGQLSQAKCLGCHTEIRVRVQDKSGFHGKLSDSKRDCQTCHLEHQGVDFKLVDWGAKGKSGFDHSQTGWPLKGKHAAVSCDACHDIRRIADPLVLALLKKNPGHQTQLGLPKACSSCHFDEHRGQLGQDCQTCHKETSWKPAPGFNHDKTEYPLRGAHKAVACSKCHESKTDSKESAKAFPAPVSQSFLKYSPLEHSSCQSCHTDPHEGKFVGKCESCHVVNDWKTMKQAGEDRTFHDQTRFPLKGEHADVPCQSCHGPWRGSKAKFKGLKFENCSDCHIDAHEGQMTFKTAKGKVPKCDTCHTEDGFLPVHFDLAEHQKTRYPLEGAHQAVACNECHLPNPHLASLLSKTVRALLETRKRPVRLSLAAFHFEKNADKCETCHADPHGGQFTLRTQGGAGCISCHSVAAWSALKFNHDQETGFPLVGAHRTTECAECHPKVTLHGQTTVKYRPLPLECSGCHADVHVAQFAGASGKTDCASCHTSNQFSQLLFQHAPPFTDYLLEGQHQKVACEGCHPAVAVSAQVKSVRYRPLPKTCEGCHADFHHGEFKGFSP